jgi:3-isopropylmalate/(R)-2-methylmalate dehydratase small subunit
VVDSLMDQAAQGENARFTVDLEACEVRAPDGTAHRFEIDPFRRHCLLEGLDEIGQSLQKNAEIEAFETRQKHAQPWLHG